MGSGEAMREGAVGGDGDDGDDGGGDEVKDVKVSMAAAVEAIDDSMGFPDRGWLGAPAGASTSGNVAVAVPTASSGASSGSGSGSESESGSGSWSWSGGSVVDMLLAVGVLGLLLLPALFRRMRSTSDGRAFRVGRKPSIQAEFNSSADTIGCQAARAYAQRNRALIGTAVRK